MKMATKKHRVLYAAMAGLLTVASQVGCGQPPASQGPSTSPAPQPAAQDVIEKHACKGMNACKGKGGCKTDKNSCKGMNDCKGQGGCKTA